MYSRRHARRSAVLAAAALSSVPLSAALDNGVMRPHMGWSTWNTLRTNFNESILRDVADAIVATGMVGSGYSVLAIDDSWPLPKRAADGSIVVNPALFPSGMRALATYLSARGMSLGIYTAHCALTCLGFPGSLGHEAQDAATYASWPATYVKNDYCIYSGGGGCNDTEAFSAMRDALNATDPFSKVAGIANSWRIAADMDGTWASVLRLLDIAAPLGGYASPGSFLDLDMLYVGTGMAECEDRSHFSMWAMMASPLVSGNDPRSQSAATTAILTNALVIAVDQDAAVVPARIVVESGDCRPGLVPASPCSWQAWARPLSDGSTALALLNRVGNVSTPTAINISVLFTEVDWLQPNPYEALDLWAGGASLGLWTGAIWAMVPSHDIVLLRLVPQL